MKAKKQKTPAYAKLDSSLKALIHRCGNKSTERKRKVRVIVQYKTPVRQVHLEQLRKAAGNQGTFQHCKLPLIQAVAVQLPVHSLKQLHRHQAVRRFMLDRRRTINLDKATPTVGASALQLRGLNGRGVTIAIVDTGIYPHRDLTRPFNRIAAFRDFVNGRTKPYDDNGHGTHCAGDAAGNGFASKGKYKGPASGAKLIGVKVLDRQGSGLDSTVIRGIDWCVRNRKKYGIRIVSLSLGAKAQEGWRSDPLCLAVDAAWRKGLVVVTAAGNSGPGRGTIESPGIVPNAITVGAANDENTILRSDDIVAGFSSRGPARGGISKPDLVAPGVNIISLRVPGSALDRSDTGARVGSFYFKLSGTSMATPIVAGVAAQLLQSNPRLNPGQVKALLKRYAYRLRNNAAAQGSGEVNARFIR